MKLDYDSFREIADALVRNRSRSLLTGFGVFWGIFMLLFMVGGGQGLKQLIGSNFEGFATNTTIMVSSQTTKPWKGFKEGRYWNLTYTDVDRLKMLIPELETVTPCISTWGTTSQYGENSYSGNFRGVYADYVNIEEPQIEYGRYINESDVLQERKVCVLGKRVYNNLFPGGGDPCGKFVKVGPAYYQVIGVDYSSGNISVSGSADESITAPLPVVQKILNRGSVVDLVCATGRSGVRMSDLEPRMRQVMARQHQFDPSDKQALFILNTEQLFSLIDNLFTGVNFLIWLVGLGTILAGVIGVSNIMMVTVKERTTEIGIRRAIGATPRDILSQIIMESISLTLAAGSFGIVFSVLLLSLLEKIVAATGDSINFQIGFWTAVVAALMLTALGVIAGLAPASRAMAIKPVDAMRDE
ncbi:MAG: ABC transporter permease [Bacteroidales bacterium]|nr:ABC transporter permease [Bacteroidales bacterium]MBO4565907.1 ABC transporter permease [Bacteroidales bacterium]